MFHITIRVVVSFSFLLFGVTCFAQSTDLHNPISFSVTSGIAGSSTSVLPKEVFLSPYVGGAAIQVADPNMTDYPVESYFYHNRLHSTQAAAEFGFEIAIKNQNGISYYIGTSRTGFEYNAAPAKIRMPFRYTAGNEASYSRLLSVENRSYSLGMEKQFFSFSPKIDVAVRAGLQLIQSSLGDWHYFEIKDAYLRDVSRFDKYALKIPASYAVELGLNTRYQASQHLSLDLYGGYLLDISRSSYQFESQTDNFDVTDGQSYRRNIWEIDSNPEARLLSRDGSTYVNSNTDFSNWYVRMRANWWF